MPHGHEHAMESWTCKCSVNERVICLQDFIAQPRDLSLSHYLSFCFIFCSIFCLIFSGSFHLSHRKCPSDLAVIQGTVICGFVLFLLCWVAFLTILSLAENEMKTQSYPFHLDFGASPSFLSPLVEMSFWVLDPDFPGGRWGWLY